MANTGDIQRRIKSVKNTRQITKAMEMVSAAKMRKAQNQALATRAYANLAWDLLQRASKKGDPRIHRLLRRPEAVKKVAIVLITSNRGLIGAFNGRVISTALKFAKKFESVDFITLGKRGTQTVKKHGYEVVADFEKQDTANTVSEISSLARLVVDDFVSGKYDQVSLVYMDFVSTLVQKSHVRNLLPLSKSGDETLGEVGLDQKQEEINDQTTKDLNIDYKFEPSPDQVLKILLPRLATMQIYQALLETNAAEHSARMVAMKNASESASELVDDLTLEFNKIRQAAITKEISEIVGGQAAIE